MAETVFAIIPELLQAHAMTFTGYDIVFDDAAYTPTENPYIKGDYLPNVVDNLFLGNDAPARHIGLLQLTVVAKAGDLSTIAATDIAGKLAAHFPKGLALQENTVKVKVYAKPTVAGPITVDFQLRVPVTIPWRSFN